MKQTNRYPAEQILVDLLRLPGDSETTICHIESWLYRLLPHDSFGIEVDEYANMFVRIGDSSRRPYLVAHTDTVHAWDSPLNHLDIIAHNGCMFGWSNGPIGCGADDRVGIWSSLVIASDFAAANKSITLAFMADEETGCRGSYAADIRRFDDAAYLIQNDRQGIGDCITQYGHVTMTTLDFDSTIMPILDGRGYSIRSSASFTDVRALVESGLSCPAINLSSGYYLPHSDGEFVRMDDAFQTLDLIRDLLMIPIRDYGKPVQPVLPDLPVQSITRRWQYDPYLDPYGFGEHNPHNRKRGRQW